MTQSHKAIDNLLHALAERAKELNCLYTVEELFSDSNNTIASICRGIIDAIPPGWQYPDICMARITVMNDVYSSPHFSETPWVLQTDIVEQNTTVGTLEVFYREERPAADEGPFLKEERKLITAIAERLGRRILHENLKSIFESEKEVVKRDWWVIIEMLTHTDPKLLIRISRKMLNQLCWNGIPEAETLLADFSPAYRNEESELLGEVNQPYKKRAVEDILKISNKIFHIAGEYLGEKEILQRIQKWIKEDRSGFLVNILENPGTTLSEIAAAIERYHHLTPQGLELSSPREKGFRVSLIRRLLADQPHFINIAKPHIEVEDFFALFAKIIFPSGSHGKIGGKSAGLLLAYRVLINSARENPQLGEIKLPKTWYLTSDGILSFMQYNNLEEIVEQKYKEIGQVRQEYPYVVQLFKNSLLPPEIINGLSVALDDFDEVPLIVRSSSLLEDRMGTAFAGKYKSLFIANQGTKKERLQELIDAVTEVYASTFGPDPIEYRLQRGMVDFHEEMGILIQEVVGTRVGSYFFPAFAGVAFSQNEFRWSKRLKRENGLMRLVPGLGTRAVDRLSDDYPILVAPGEPDLRVNVTLEEKIRYSPQKIDVVNLETRSLETLSIKSLLKNFGPAFPLIERLVSILDQDRIYQPVGIEPDFGKYHPVVTFEGLLSNTNFPNQMHSVLTTLEDNFQTPVDVEFAHDGKDFYLLQCRPLSSSEAFQPAEIPHDLPPENLIFSGNRYIPNGVVPNITHIVYVDPLKYGELPGKDDLLAVGEVVGKLNGILPKRQFILMGPGRWGSRGDIKLGVNISYSGINNSAMLIEIARQQKDYLPDLSFGTHFFQDLVESSIRYLPLYPDDPDTAFNENFLNRSHNTLAEIFPEFARLSETVKVIDVRKVAGGKVLKVLMNAEIDTAVAILAEPEESIQFRSRPLKGYNPPDKDVHWRWRLVNAEYLAACLEPERFGIKAAYIFGSTKNATAGPGSDIDLLIHINGNEAQKKDLEFWLEGWSLSLSQANYLRTGHQSNGLLDVHFVTDEDIRKRTSFAVKIGAATDAARPLQLGTSQKS